MSYLKQYRTRRVPQSEAIPGTTQVPNSAGGFAWEVDAWTRLRRFLVLGSEGGSFYADQRALTRQNAVAVAECLAVDGIRAVDEIVRVSEAGRAPKVQPALFALAMAAGAGDERVRRAALDALPRVARTAAHLFQFVGYVEQFRGWGRSLRRAVGAWYAERPVDALAYQAVKYRQREGMTHRDLLRLAHPGGQVSAGNPTLDVSPEHASLMQWIVRGEAVDGLPRLVEGFILAQASGTPARTAELVREYGLPREALLSEHLTSPEVWEALLEAMPIGALVRNLATMTRIGVLGPGSDATTEVARRLADGERIAKARLHPIAVLAALRTYASGRGVRGSGIWAPVREVVDALDAAFYLAFGNVESTGRRMLLALDVSGSMGMGEVAGVPGLSPRDASAALALVTAATESAYEVVGFTGASRGGWKSPRGSRFRNMVDRLSPLSISPRQRLDDAVKAVSGLPFGGTDCALPMQYAQATGQRVDTFVIYTDSETWAGAVHPARALRDYRQASGIDARLVVVGMVSNGFTIADPDDAGMLDVVGFDTATPQLIAGFARGEV